MTEFSAKLVVLALVIQPLVYVTTYTILVTEKSRVPGPTDIASPGGEKHTRQ